MRYLGVSLSTVVLLAGCSQQVAPFCLVDSDCPANHTCDQKFYTCFKVKLDLSIPDIAPMDMAPDVAADAGSDVPLPDLLADDVTPVDLLLPDLPGAGTKCGGDSACGTAGGCVDGYCCDTSCVGLCQACNVAGKEGTCSPVPQGTDPDNECTGTPPCGGDLCNGQGKCTVFAGTKKLCDSKCNGSNQDLVDEYFCDAAGSCSKTPFPSSCSPFRCDGVKGICYAGCMGNTQCVNKSACDRTQAHAYGTGYCVPTAKVALVNKYKDIVDELYMQEFGTTTRTHIRLAAGTYIGTFNFKAKNKVIITGDKGAVIQPSSSNTDPGVVYLQDGANVALQGLVIKKSLGSQSGVACQTTTTGNAWLTLLECWIQDNPGLGLTTNGCNVVARRNRIFDNFGTGIRIYNGSAVVTNNLLLKNGLNGGADVGGVDLNPGTGNTVEFVNNTLVDNVKASDASLSGMRCQGFSTPLVNNIIYDNTTKTTKSLATGCTFANSIVPQGGGKNGNLSKSPSLKSSSHMPLPGSPCIDAGQTTTATVIDFNGTPRPAIANGKTDIGCFEVK